MPLNFNAQRTRSDQGDPYIVISLVVLMSVSLRLVSNLQRRMRLIIPLEDGGQSKGSERFLRRMSELPPSAQPQPSGPQQVAVPLAVARYSRPLVSRGWRAVSREQSKTGADSGATASSGGTVRISSLYGALE